MGGGGGGWRGDIKGNLQCISCQKQPTGACVRDVSGSLQCM